MADHFAIDHAVLEDAIRNLEESRVMVVQVTGGICHCKHVLEADATGVLIGGKMYCVPCAFEKVNAR